MGTSIKTTDVQNSPTSGRHSILVLLGCIRYNIENSDGVQRLTQVHDIFLNNNVLPPEHDGAAVLLPYSQYFAATAMTYICC